MPFNNAVAVVALARTLVFHQLAQRPVQLFIAVDVGRYPKTARAHARLHHHRPAQLVRILDGRLAMPDKKGLALRNGHAEIGKQRLGQILLPAQQAGFKRQRRHIGPEERKLTSFRIPGGELVHSLALGTPAALQAFILDQVVVQALLVKSQQVRLVIQVRSAKAIGIRIEPGFLPHKVGLQRRAVDIRAESRAITKDHPARTRRFKPDHGLGHIGLHVLRRRCCAVIDPGKRGHQVVDSARGDIAGADHAAHIDLGIRVVLLHVCGKLERRQQPAHLGDLDIDGPAAAGLRDRLVVLQIPERLVGHDHNPAALTGQVGIRHSLQLRQHGFLTARHRLFKHHLAVRATGLLQLGHQGLHEGPRRLGRHRLVQIQPVGAHRPDLHVHLVHRPQARQVLLDIGGSLAAIAPIPRPMLDEGIQKIFRRMVSGTGRRRGIYLSALPAQQIGHRFAPQPGCEVKQRDLEA